MGAHHSPSTLAIEVKIPYVESFAGLSQVLRIAREDCSGQAVLRVVGELERMLEVFRPRNSQNRPEYLLLENTSLGINIRNDRGWNEVAASLLRLTAYHHSAFLLADVNVLQDGPLRTRTDHWSHKIAGIIGWSHLDAARFGRQFVQERVVHPFVDDRPRTGGALLTLVAESRGEHPIDGAVEIAITIDYDGVLAPHLGDYPLDPHLPGLVL